MKHGILLVNDGVPAEDSPEALRRYAETILGTDLFTEGLGIVNAGMFKKITIPAKAKAWRNHFFPGDRDVIGEYRATAESLRSKLSAYLATSSRKNCAVAMGFRCGSPSLADAAAHLKEEGCDSILIVPLHPLYFKPLVDPALTDARRAIEQAADARWSPKVKELLSFCEAPGFAKTLADRIMKDWQPRSVSRLLLLMPSQPRLLSDSDKTFAKQVEHLKTQLEKLLGLGYERIHAAYVSDFDNSKWTGPFAEKTLMGWIGGAVKDVRAASPVFCAADPLGDYDAGFKIGEFFMANSAGKRPEYRFVPSFGDDDGFVKVLGGAIAKAL